MQVVPKKFMENLRIPEELQPHVVRDDDGQYWVSCQLRSALIKRDVNFYPRHALMVMRKYTLEPDGTVIFEDLRQH